MPTRAADLPRGTPVSWAYRATRGYGHILGRISIGRRARDDRYSIRQVDNHISAAGNREPRTVIHARGNIRRETPDRVDRAAQTGRARQAHTARPHPLKRR